MGCRNHPEITTGLVNCARCGQAFCPNCVVYLQGSPFCAGCKVEQVRNVQSGVGGGGSLELAGILHRFAAQFIDGLILGIPMVIVMFAIMIGVLGFSFSDPEGMAAAAQGGAFTMFQILAGLVMGAVYVVYEALMLAARGQTLGKMALGIKVVTPEGNPLTTGQAWGRAACRQGLGLLSCCGILIDYLPAFFTDEKTCVHDMAAKTRVVFAR